MFVDNGGLGHYGPTNILKHQINSVSFITLYGHLSRASLDELVIGKTFTNGERLVKLGIAIVNGGWKNDFPGVCSKSERKTYLENCPNPNLLLKIEA